MFMTIHAATVRMVETPAATIRCREVGDRGGPPVLLLHGGSSSADTWNGLAAALAAAGCRAVAADLRGHGGSSRTATYPLVGFRDDVLGLLDALELEAAALVGHSLGGHVATLVAQEQPERITRLVLEEPPVPARGPSDERGLSLARFLLPVLGGLGLRRGFDRRALVSAIRQLRVPDPVWWDRLESIAAPTLLISGGPGSHISAQRLAEVAQRIRHGRLVTIPVGHRVHSRSPERFLAAVVPFLTADG